MNRLTISKQKINIKSSRLIKALIVVLKSFTWRIYTLKFSHSFASLQQHKIHIIHYIKKNSPWPPLYTNLKNKKSNFNPQKQCHLQFSYTDYSIIETISSKFPIRTYIKWTYAARVTSSSATRDDVTRSACLSRDVVTPPALICKCARKAFIRLSIEVDTVSEFHSRCKFVVNFAFALRGIFWNFGQNERWVPDI